MDILITDNGDGGDVVVREPIQMWELPLSLTVVCAFDTQLSGSYPLAIIEPPRWAKSEGSYIERANNIWTLTDGAVIYTAPGDWTFTVPTTFTRSV